MGQICLESMDSDGERVVVAWRRVGLAYCGASVGEGKGRVRELCACALRE